MSFPDVMRLLFGFWFAIFLGAALPSARGWQNAGLSGALRGAQRGLLAGWLVFAAVGALGTAAGQPTYRLIPEPGNTAAFLAVGGAVMGTYALGWIANRLRMRRLLRSARQLEALQSLSPQEFEELVAEHFRRQGCRARRVGAQGDHGVDVIVTTAAGNRWVVQCKRWRGQVGEPLVRDFFGVLNHERAAHGFLITTGSFTPQARAWAEGKPLSLWDGEEVVERIKEKG